MVKGKTKKTCLLIFLSVIMVVTCCSASAFAVENVDYYFVYISQKDDPTGIFKASVGYLGEGSYNNETAYYVTPNATIYGSIAAVVDDYGKKSIDRTIGGFDSSSCNISRVAGSGDVFKEQYVLYHIGNYDQKETYLQFNAQPGDIFYLDYYWNWHGEVTATQCYFIVK